MKESDKHFVETVRKFRGVQQGGAASAVDAVVSCPVCEYKKLNRYGEPVEHWGCENCRCIFVKDERGLIGCLDAAMYLGHEDD
jgi:hypothetical protein